MNLVERTAALVPMLRQHAAAAERERRVPVETLGALDQAGVFRMMAPKRFGGDEASFETQCRVLAEIARGCPSTSWVATIYSAMAWTASVFPDRAQDEIFAGGVPRIAGVFSPTGTAVCKDDGFIVNGRWPYNTGCHGAQWTLVVALATQDGGYASRHRIRRLKLRADHPRRLVRERHGRHRQQHRRRRASCSSLPIARCRCRNMVQGRYPERHNSGKSYFNYPLAQVLVVNGGGTPLGIARGALEAFFDRFRAAASCTRRNGQIGRAVTHLQVGEASLKIDSAIAHVRARHGHAGRPSGRRADGAGPGAVARAHRLRDGPGTRGRHLLFYASGASSIQSNVPMQRFQRDMQALANHVVMNSPTAVEL